MIIIRKANDRGNGQHGWLNSFHTFSFAGYHDPKFMGFGDLRVINEDTVQPGRGFGRHAHHDMEIISYVIEGSLEHKDSLGTGSIIKPGEIQRMSAGTGVEHSEFNPSATDILHFLQIWIIPEKRGLKPEYEQKSITKKPNELILIASRDGGNNTLIVHQDVALFVAYVMTNHSVNYPFSQDRTGWLQLVKGEITLNGNLLGAGDGAAIFNESNVEITGLQDAELLLFDLLR